VKLRIRKDPNTNTYYVQGRVNRAWILVDEGFDTEAELVEAHPKAKWRGHQKWES
jgi:glyoxylase-like metal-dependent hydrolase (beta-lactamase superfamily II)